MLVSMAVKKTSDKLEIGNNYEDSTESVDQKLLGTRFAAVEK